MGLLFNIRARARQIQRWILRARAQKISPLYREEKSVPRPGAIDPKVDSPRPSAEIFSPIFLSYIEKKIVSALSYIEKKIVSALGRGRSKGGFSAPEGRKFSPLYREENRFRAVDPKVDSPRPSAENFLPYIEKKIVSALGRGRSKGGFSAPERRKFSPLYREENRFRAWAR